MRSLNDPWTLAGRTIPNRVVLAPLAGIGNWFVRPQAKRYGAGLVVSEMVSSFGIHYGNEKTVPKVCKTGAGAALLKDPDTAIAVAAAAREGSGLPVTVKLRSGQKKGDVD